MTQSMAGTAVDIGELARKVKEMYALVANNPAGDFHFEMGRGLAERLGYPTALLDAIPVGALESFAGVGYFLDLADIAPGERVLDLGSGSGADVFGAAALAGGSGRVLGVDFTPAQLAKSRRLADESRTDNVEFLEGRIEDLPVSDGSVDCVISNGVINLAPHKVRVFAEAARVLRPGGRLALADIVTEQPLTEAIVCNVDLWASCIGGAPQENTYFAAIEAAGLRVEVVRQNPYEFVSGQARTATERYGVKSISVLARKPTQ